MTRSVGDTPIRVAVVSAHEGSASWRGLLSSIVSGGGVTVRSISAYSDPEYRSSRTPLERLRLRFKTYVLFPLRVVWERGKLARDFDAIIVITSPFYLPALIAAVVAGPRIVVLQNDIYPEALIIKKLIRRGGVVERTLKRMIAAALRKAAVVVYIAEEHRELVARNGAGTPHDVVIAVPSSLSPPIGDRTPKAPGPTTALYAGTLGTMHDTSTFLEYLATRSTPPGVQFVFRTSGAGKASFERAVASRFPDLLVARVISLGDSLTDEAWSSMMLTAEVGLVFQDAGAGAVVFPSKAASILVAGQALLVIADATSSLGRIVADGDCGWVVRPGDVDSLHKALVELSTLEILERKRANARRIGRDRYALDIVARQWRGALGIQDAP